MKSLRNWGIAVVALGATVMMAASAAAAITSLPAPEELPANVVAYVSDVPVSTGRITDAEFQRALEQQAVTAGRHSAPKPGGKGYEALRDHAIGELLDAVWIKGQALAMGIAVTGNQVAGELARIKRTSFENEDEYREFLRESRYTQRDVNERVELQLLSTRIQERVARGATGARDAQAKFKEFADAYSERWRNRTVCAAGVVIDRCSNGPLPS